MIRQANPGRSSGLGRLPLPPELGSTRVRHFGLAEVGYIRLRLGEGWGEGFWSLDRFRTPSPQPSPQRGEGAHRVCGIVRQSSFAPDALMMAVHFGISDLM